jgi:hypothetical protein
MHAHTFGGGLTPSNQTMILIESPLTSFTNCKNDLNFAPVTNIYILANTLIWAQPPLLIFIYLQTYRWGYIII